MTLQYWILFARDPTPTGVAAEQWVELAAVLDRLVRERGPIVWMIRRNV